MQRIHDATRLGRLTLILLAWGVRLPRRTEG